MSELTLKLKLLVYKLLEKFYEKELGCRFESEEKFEDYKMELRKVHQKD